MSYNYPSHFKYPDERIFFTDHIDLWESVLVDLKDKPNKTMIDEIHFDEEIYAKFFSKEDYLDKMIRSLKMFI